MKLLKAYLKIITTAGIISLLSISSLASANFNIEILNEEGKNTQLNDTLSPGEKKEYEIQIQNTQDQPLTIDLYKVDGITNTPDENTPPQALGKWIEFDTTSFEVEPLETITAPFQINIPENTTPGSYTATVAGKALNTQPPSETSEQASTSLPIYIEISEEKITALEVQNFYYFETPTAHNFDILLKNSGNTALTVTSNIIIDNQETQENLTSKDTILSPNETTKHTLSWRKQTIFDPFQSNNPTLKLFKVQKPLFGKFNTQLYVTYSDNNVANTTDSNKQLKTRTLSFTVIPWGNIAIILSILIILIGQKVIRKKILKRARSKCIEYTIKPGDTIINIAQRTGIKWKKLVKINNLSPPYSLEPGSKILAPPTTPEETTSN